MYASGLEYDFRSTKSGSIPFTPFVTGGVGAMHYNIDGDFLSTQATNLVGNVGVGADFVVGRGVALRLMAKDYIGQFNFRRDWIRTHGTDGEQPRADGWFDST
jgi:hypothetical protein